MARKQNHEDATHDAQTQASTGENMTQNASAQKQNQTPQSSQGMQRSSRQPSGMTRRGGGVPSPFVLNPYEMLFNPFGFMRRMQDEMDRMFEDFGAPTPFETGRSAIAPRNLGVGTFAPQIEVFERDNNLIVRADLPGVNKDDVRVEFTDEGLVLEGERRFEHESNEQGLHRTERAYGSFYRLIPLPEGVNPENAKATFRNGVLEVTMQLPQQQSSRRRLEIQGEQGQTQGTQNQTTEQVRGQSAGK